MSGVPDAATFRREPDLDRRVAHVLAREGPSGGYGSEARAACSHVTPLAILAEAAASAPRYAHDACSWLHAALDAAARGVLGDAILNRLLLACGQSHITHGTQRAARAVLRVLAGVASRRVAVSAEQAAERSTARWLKTLADLMDVCGLEPPKTVLPAAPSPSPPPSPPPLATVPEGQVPTTRLHRSEATLVLLPLAREANGGTRHDLFALPGGDPRLMFGMPRDGFSRDEDELTAVRWAAQLFGLPSQAFYLYTLDELNVTVYTTPRGVLEESDHARERQPMQWLKASAAEAPLRQLIDLARHQMLRHVQPASALPLNVRTGALAPQRLVPQQLIVHAQHSRLSWAEVERRANDTHAVLAGALREAIATLGDTPRGLRESLQGWLLKIEPAPLDDVPEGTRAAAFESKDARLASIPFPRHAAPVATPPLPPLPKAPPAGAVPPGTLGWHQVLRPQARHLLRR